MPVRSHILKTTWRTSPIFMCMLAVGVARSFSVGVAIRYILPVLWMTSFLHNGFYVASCVFVSGESVTTKSIPTRWGSTINISRYSSTVGCTPEVKSVVYDCLVMHFAALRCLSVCLYAQNSSFIQDHHICKRNLLPKPFQKFRCMCYV